MKEKKVYALCGFIFYKEKSWRKGKIAASNQLGLK